MNNNGVVITTGMIALIVFVLIGVSAYVAYDSGYMPIDPLLTAEEPVGTADVVEIPSDCLSCDRNYCQDWFEAIKGKLPILSVKYQMWSTDATEDEVHAEYREELLNAGYELYRIRISSIDSSNDDANLQPAVQNPGTVIIDGFLTTYALYVKGITFVLVLTADDSQPYVSMLKSMGTCVIYATGSLLTLEKELGDSSIITGEIFNI